MTCKLYQLIASSVAAATNCKRDLDNPNRIHESMLPLRQEWLERHREMAEALTKEFMPSGSGFDLGTQLLDKESTGEKLVFYVSFHHMDDNGMYDGWTDHTVTVRPSLVYGFTVSVSGRNRNDIKDSIAETFQAALGSELSRDDETALAVRLGYMAEETSHRPEFTGDGGWNH